MLPSLLLLLLLLQGLGVGPTCLWLPLLLLLGRVSRLKKSLITKWPGAAPAAVPASPCRATSFQKDELHSAALHQQSASPPFQGAAHLLNI